jgi:hypothetical protein
MSSKLKISTFAFLLAASATVHAGCIIGADESNKIASYMGGGGPIKLHHVQGKHSCWSRDLIGYSCEVETRDATDCGSGHMRLKNMNCCHFHEGKRQIDARSNGYTPGRCSPFM